MGKNVDKTVHTWYLKGGATEQVPGNSLKSGNGVFVKHGIISIGYWLDGDDRDNFNEINNFEDYQKYYETFYEAKKGKTWNNSPQAQLYDRLKKGDIVWTRVFDSIYADIKDGYYVARIHEDPKTDLFYCNGKCGHDFDFINLKKADCLVGLKGIDWQGPFSEDAVPGSVTRYIMGKTIVRVDSKEKEVFDTDGNPWTYTSAVSYFMYNEDKKHPSEIEFQKLSLDKPEDKLNFFKLIGWRGLEDIAALWIQQECGYYLQPSTCKSGTPSYEYVLIDPETKKRIFVQTKNDDSIILDPNKYRKLLSNGKDEFYLVTTGSIKEHQEKIVILKMKKESDKEVSLDKLINFIFDDENNGLLPEHILECKKKLFNCKKGE